MANEPIRATLSDGMQHPNLFQVFGKQWPSLREPPAGMRLFCCVMAPLLVGVTATGGKSARVFLTKRSSMRSCQKSAACVGGGQQFVCTDAGRTLLVMGR